MPKVKDWADFLKEVDIRSLVGFSKSTSDILKAASFFFLSSCEFRRLIEDTEHVSSFLMAFESSNVQDFRPQIRSNSVIANEPWSILLTIFLNAFGMFFPPSCPRPAGCNSAYRPSHVFLAGQVQETGTTSTEVGWVVHIPNVKIPFQAFKYVGFTESDMLMALLSPSQTEMKVNKNGKKIF